VDAAREEPPVAAAPTAGGQRIETLDVARGLALLGILLVNVEYFFQPLGRMIGPAAPPERGLSLGLWWLVETLCVGKLYPLFSLLFGMGLALQRRRVEAAGGRFAALAVRRLGFLAVLGLLHGLLLWYGDILFAYSVVGAVLVAVGGASPRKLLGAGFAALALAVLLGAFVGALGAASPGPVGGPLPEIGERPFEVVLQQLRSSSPGGPADPYWQAAEVAAYRRGPWLQAEGFRVVSYALLLLSLAAGGGLEILAMFLLGAGLVRSDLFGAGSGWIRWLGRGGLTAGLPLGLVAAWLGGFGAGPGALAASAALRTVSGAALALGYLGVAHALVIAAARLGAARGLAGVLRAAGRAALSHYLLQTVIVTALAYHWGLAWFGTLERPGRVAVALAVYTVLALAAGAWLARFRFGPLEWLWRSFTYGTLQPLRRRAPERDPAGG
jgi:uncharacterized protein